MTINKSTHIVSCYQSLFCILDDIVTYTFLVVACSIYVNTKQ